MAIDLGAVALAVTPDMANFGSEVEEGVESHTSSFRESGKKIATAVGAGMAAAGGMAEGFARSSQDANLALHGMARRAGTSSDAMRDMARDMQNATFPMDEVVGLMELATKRGLEGEAIKEYGNFWDMVGDATNESSQSLAEAGVALGRVGIAAGNEAEALDAFGYVTDNSAGSVEDFLRFIKKTGSELGDNTPHINDMAGALEALEENGYDSSEAQRQLKQALSESDGDMVAALDTLGVSESEFREYADAVEGSGSAIEDQAQAVMDAQTPMQKMQARVEEVMFQYGGLADAAGMVAAPLSGVGLAMMGVAQVGPSVVGATKKVGGALAGMAKAAVTSTATVLKQMALQVAAWVRVGVQSMIHAAKVAAAWLISMGPIAIVIAAVVGLVTLIIKNWDKIKKVIAAGWDFVKRITTRVWDAVAGFLSDTWDSIKRLVSNSIDKVKRFISSGLDKIKEPWNRVWTAVKDFVSDRFSDVVGFVKGLPGRAKSALSGAWNTYKSFWQSIFTAAKDFVADRIGNVIGFIKDLPRKAKAALSGAWSAFGSFWSDKFTAVKDFASGRVEDVVNFIKGLPRNAKRNLMGNWSKFSSFWEDKFDAVKDFVSDKIDDIVDFFADLPGRIVDALGDVASKIKKKFTFDLPDINVPFVGGDGPGKSRGGKALSRVQSALTPGTYVTSTYRSPAQNRAVGGSPTSYHLDRNNPAVDIGGSTAALNLLAGRLRAMGGWREFLWQTAGHYDHIHVAHEGGTITRDGLAPLRSDERLIRGQVGETILPKDYAGTSSLVDEVRALRAEVRRQTDRHLLMTRTA